MLNSTDNVQWVNAGTTASNTTPVNLNQRTLIGNDILDTQENTLPVIIVRARGDDTVPTQEELDNSDLREVRKGTQFSGWNTSSTPNLWVQAANGLATTVTTLLLGGDDPLKMTPEELATWKAQHPDRSLGDGKPTLTYRIDLSTGTMTRVIGTTPSLGASLLDTITLGLLPLGRSLGTFFGGLNVSTDGNLSSSTRSQGAFDAGGNVLSVPMAVAIIVTPALKAPEGAGATGAANGSTLEGAISYGPKPGAGYSSVVYVDWSGNPVATGGIPKTGSPINDTAVGTNTETSIVTSEGAANAVSGLNLNKSLTSSQQLSELASGGGSVMAGNGSSVVLRDAPRLASEYGGSLNDWSKVSSSSAIAPDGTVFEIHAYRNVVTGQVVEPKTIQPIKLPGKQP